MTKLVSTAEMEYILAFANAYVKSNDYDELFEAFPGCHFSGCTKIVFVLDELENWVIKIDLGGLPYCQREADNYAAAVKENLAEYFAATYFFTEVDGVKFYIQELLDCHDDFGDDLSCEVSQACFDYLKNTSDFEDNDDIFGTPQNKWKILSEYMLLSPVLPIVLRFFLIGMKSTICMMEILVVEQENMSLWTSPATALISRRLPNERIRNALCHGILW